MKTYEVWIYLWADKRICINRTRERDRGSLSWRNEARRLDKRSSPTRVAAGYDDSSIFFAFDETYGTKYNFLSYSNMIEINPDIKNLKESATLKINQKVHYHCIIVASYMNYQLLIESLIAIIFLDWKEIVKR